MTQSLEKSELLQHPVLATWESLKIFSTVALWVVFAILVYLRYARNAGGRQLALWTIVAFGLLLFSLASYDTGANSSPGGV